MLKLIPAVKSLKIQEGFLRKKAILSAACADARLEKALGKLPRAADGVPVTVAFGCGEGEGYTLTVTENAIDIRGESAAGAFYAAQTLRQLFAHEKVPCLRIEDQPDFPIRGFYHDITRGRISTLESLKSLIDDMAYYKLNHLQLYVEHVFPFRETADLIKKTGCITPEELVAVQDYCRENFIEFVPSLSTFGHMYEILELPQYKHLAVLPEFEPSPNFWAERMAHHSLNPLVEGSFQLADSLIDQYYGLFESEYFNICCDETFDIDRYLQCDDPGKVYADFVKKLIATVKARGKKVMMWADILLKHPQVIDDIPEDTIFLNWKYIKEPPEELVQTLAEMGKTQIVCPGNTAWNRLCENVEVEEGNITAMVRYGKKWGALGVLNTNWGDWGHPCSLELGMYGLVLGAGISWDTTTAPGEEFDRAVDMHLYAHEGAMALLRQLSQLHKGVVWKDFVCSVLQLPQMTKSPHIWVEQEDFAQLQEAMPGLEEALSQPWERDNFRREFRSCARGLWLMAQLSRQIAGFDTGTCPDTHSWLADYRANWLVGNKESELNNIEKLFRTAHALATK